MMLHRVFYHFMGSETLVVQPDYLSRRKLKPDDERVIFATMVV